MLVQACMPTTICSRCVRASQSQVTHFDTLHDKETKFNRRKRAFEAQQSAKQQDARASVKGGTPKQSPSQ